MEIQIKYSFEILLNKRGLGHMQMSRPMRNPDADPHLYKIYFLSEINKTKTNTNPNPTTG